MLGIYKLNTAVYHPQCDGMVKRFSKTLKMMLHKHTAKYGSQWDEFLPGVSWAYHNTSYAATGKRPSYLLFGVNCHSPTEAAFMTPNQYSYTNICQELVLSLSAALEEAAKSIQKVQKRYKKHYDKKMHSI